MARSSARMADSIISVFQPRAVLDVGCGSGSLLFALQERGVECFGYDVADASLRMCREKGLCVERLNLEDIPEAVSRTADLVVSIEVAEHLPEMASGGFPRRLVELTSRYLLITAATPGQGGTDHVNEQPHSYWIEQLVKLEMEFLDDVTHEMRASWITQGVSRERARNVMVFRRRREL